MSQSDLVLARLKRGPLTPLQALHELGCFRLAARVHDLRARGHYIAARLVKRGDSHVAQYRLERTH